MTRRPPDPLPDPGLVVKDGTVIPGAEAVEAWHRAALEHKARLKQEDRRYRAECAALRERFGPPSGAAQGKGMSWPAAAWHQADFDDLARDDPASDDEVVFSSPDGEWFAADAAAYLPPCERSS